MSKESGHFLFSDFIETGRKFASGASPKDLASVFPGYIASPGECFFPTDIPVKGSFRCFRVTVGLDKPVSLCFSKIIFVGTVDGDDALVDVSDLAEFEMSSQHAASSSPASAIEGAVFSNNIHSEKEVNPWWQARFPENVRVERVYLYRRSDWSIIHEQHLRIIGMAQDGEETVLYYPESAELHQPKTLSAIGVAANALEARRRELNGDLLVKYDALILDALSDIAGWMEQSVDTGKCPSVSSKDRSGAAGKILAALSLALGGAKDFGTTRDEGLEIDLSGVDARHIRLRTFGETPVGFGGLEVYSGEADQPVKTFDKADLKFRYNYPGFHHNDSFSVDLYTNIQSRRVDIGQQLSISKLRIWNVNQQHAANTLFLEVAVRENDKQRWRIVYDHGSTYRQTCAALTLVNYLVRGDWTPDQAQLISKLFAQYRRKRLMGPLARLVRHREHLNSAVFRGADEIWPLTKHAAPLRLGKHGLRVPIGYRDEKTVMGHLVEMRDKVRALGHKPLFMYGTLLGAIREKDFIPHDDDVDLAVIMTGAGPDEINEECDKFIELLNDNGVTANRGARHSPLIHCHRGPVTYDIFVLGHVGDTVYWPHTALKIVPERADIFLPIGEVEFKGEVFDAPADPEAVCKARYGDDWHIPNPAFEW